MSEREPCDMGCQPDWHNDDCAIYIKVTPAIRQAIAETSTTGLARDPGKQPPHRQRGERGMSETTHGDGQTATMSRAECTCPDDCDCDGRFACEAAAGATTHRCALAVGHGGWHQSGGHRWAPTPNPEVRGE